MQIVLSNALIQLSLLCCLNQALSCFPGQVCMCKQGIVRKVGGTDYPPHMVVSIDTGTPV